MAAAGETQNASSVARPKAIFRLLEDARKRLVETGTRNRLVHINLMNDKLKAVHVINERADDVYDILRNFGKRMQFLACGIDEPDEEDLLIPADAPAEPFDTARYTDNYLETPLGPDKLAKRLLSISRDAKTAEEEQGINLLYLAIGFLTWREDKNSEVERTAPLLLLPVELVRNQKTSTYDLVSRDDDLVTNLPLQERLREDFGIALPDVDETDEWSPSEYFDRIEPIVAERLGWSVNSDQMVLGLFSFAKILMMRDLEPENWKNSELLKHDLLSGLLVSGFEPDPPLFPEDTKLDEAIEPKDIVQVVDADASQTIVIEEVRAGRNLVVQGPPGTGKSQTITNIIAAAVNDGKTVLFVAEKMAALTVVHKRLVDVGLSDVCLELHSKSANKKAVLQELATTLNAAATAPETSDSSAELKEARDVLNSISTQLHSPLKGYSFNPFAALSRMVQFIGQDAPPPSIQNQTLADLTTEESDNLLAGIHRYKELLTEMGPVDEHPFYSVQETELQPLDLERLKIEADKAAELTSQLLQSLQEATKKLELTQTTNIEIAERLLSLSHIVKVAPKGIEDLVDPILRFGRLDDLNFAIQKGTAYQSAWSASHDQFIDAALEFPTGVVRSQIAAATSFWSRLGSGYRTASKQLATVLKEALPKKQQQRLELIDTLSDLQKKQKAYKTASKSLKDVLGVAWRDDESDFVALSHAVAWCKSVVSSEVSISTGKLEELLSSKNESSTVLTFEQADIDDAVQIVVSLVGKLQLNIKSRFNTDEISNIDLDFLAKAFTDLSGNTGRYDEWREYTQLVENFERAQLLQVLKRIESGELDGNSARREFLYSQAEQQWDACRVSLPILEKLRDMSRHDLVDQFRDLEKLHVEEVRKRIHLNHLDQLPRGAVGEMAYIRGELAKKRRHKSIRQLMDNAGKMVQRIKPAFLMSPISVAQFLPPNKLTFDLLVIDEASQVKPEDALGAIVRAKQIVVVGDRKQLPPTSFFDRISPDTEAEEEFDDELGNAAKATEMESILTLCEARGLRSEMLSWHYRSRDPSLIKVSNAEFYNHQLILPPSPLEHDENYGLKLTQVDGVYSRGSSGEGKPRTNRIEAQAVVDRVKEHACQYPELSLGVVTFSVSQKSMVEELLEFERRSDKVLDHFLREGRSEDFFVKNIENVQGDERDVILISVCYGPVIPGGKLSSMRFGPVNSDGGERRLNVLFSRSRIRCEVFTSFDPREIDLSKTTKEGPRVLKAFLEFARSGILDQKMPTGLAADSPFEEDVADVVRGMGYALDHQVGSAGFRIDLAVKHPKRAGQYMIAIECDGATYHSALWARERDRLRQDILEHLGWNFHRIWSTDWFHRRDREIERLRQTLGRASTDNENGISVDGANLNYPLPTVEVSPNTVELGIVFEQPNFTGTPYIRAELNAETSLEPHEVSPKKLAELTLRIIEIEGPLHEDEIARRIAFSFGKQKAGQRIIDITKKSLNIIRKSHREIRNKNEFWMTTEQIATPPIRDRSNQNGATLKASMISPLEIRSARSKVEVESGDVDINDMARAIGSMLGFKRLGPELKEWIISSLK